jgi:hypothetical protein
MAPNNAEIPPTNNAIPIPPSSAVKKLCMMLSISQARGVFSNQAILPGAIGLVKLVQFRMRL